MIENLTDDQYNLLFDVRRSVRYHDRRIGFFTKMHQITGVFTMLMSGSIIFDIARPGNNPMWLLIVAVIAAVLATTDFVVGYASHASNHRELKTRWTDLEMEMFKGGLDEIVWKSYRLKRLLIEKDEPPVYRALDSLCHNELLVAEAHCKPGETSPHWARVSPFQRWTSQLYRWPNIVVS